MFSRRARTRLISHPSPPVKDQRKLWKQPHPASASSACEHRRHRPRFKVFLPVNAPPPRDGFDATT